MIDEDSTDNTNNKSKPQAENNTSHTKEGTAATSFLLFIWYLILWLGGILLLAFVALFVACMV